MNININTNAVVRYADTLERLSRSALPIAVRQTLNSAAFDVKQKTMPDSADNAFIRRQPNFFKANSKVTPANGFNIHSMKAIVGFIPLSGTNKAIDDLEQQEKGGDISGRSLIPLKGSRVAHSWKKNVRKGWKISDIGNRISDSKKSAGRNNPERYIRSAIHAGKGGFVIGTKKTAGGNRILFAIRSIIRRNNNTIVKSVPIYAVKRNRKVNPPATHFMQRASTKSAGSMEKNFIKHAQKQIAKYRR